MNKESFQPPHLAPEAPQPSPRGKMGPAITWSLSVVGLGRASGVPAPQGSVVHPEAEEQRVQQIYGGFQAEGHPPRWLCRTVALGHRS